MKKILCLCIVVLILIGIAPAALAAEQPNTAENISASEYYAEGLYNTDDTAIQPLSSTLILKCDLAIYLGDGKTLQIVAKTTCTDIVDKVGFKNITLQRKSGSSWVNVSTWSAYKEDAQAYLYDYRTTVTGGYYYRVVLTHYAEKGWWVFADTQEIYNETSALWVG